MSGEFGKLLDALGRDPHERLSVCHITAGGAFTAQITTAGEAPDVVAALAGGDCWYGTGVLHERVDVGRGNATDVVGLREIYADLDVKAGGMGSFASARAAVAALSAMLGVEPVAIVASGHGLQPHWGIERDEDTDWPDEHDPRFNAVTALVRRWGRLVAHVAEIHGGAVDSVYDLSRVLRAPGTINRKDPAEPVPVGLELPGGAPVSLGRLREVLDEYGITERAEDVERLDDEVSAPRSWGWSTHDCPYVRSMTRGWATDKPTDRHPWLVAQSVRLACAHRHGCLAEQTYRAALDLLAERFRTRLNVGRKRNEGHGEIAGARQWGVTRASTFSDARVREELGGHRHGMEPAAERPAVDLAHVDETFLRWFGTSYDLDVLHAVLATAAAGLVLSGDPPNLLVIGGSGAAKTETVSPLAAGGALVTSTISGEAALLSGTSERERSANATGGLLRKIGDRGLLVIKDATTILSMPRDPRTQVLAALREIADGFWERNLGTDGGLTLSWQGRVTIIGACTTAWDHAHGVIAAMGDRFALVRMPEDNALEGGAQALRNAGHEDRMRAELHAAVGGLLQHLPDVPADPAAAEFLLPLANLVTWARTAVVTDFKGDVVQAHAREHPTRFTKTLAQIYRGARCIGLDDEAARRVAVRVAGDSLPPARRAVLAGLERRGRVTSGDLAEFVGFPRQSVDRWLQALAALKIVELDHGDPTDAGRKWHWMLAVGVDADALAILLPGRGES